ncbi:fimbria/pilus outer membrane usher protein [Rosenbergiella nectarea]|uniref:fimbria/pilus outer membrane usher protein n=2 Tax=Rosenbergiella nectarea TaxID=988801 RepID=UPI001F4ECB2C|nr:fimbria/pilus outer membrane usher protein [Rosenbergiella nectarea]
MKIKYHILSLVLFMSLMRSMVYAEEADIEFNTDMIDITDRKQLHPERFTTKDYITPGQYQLIVIINSHEVGEYSINYIDSSDKRKSTPLITSELLPKLTLNEKAQHYIVSVKDSYFDISNIPGISVKNKNGKLLIDIPQVWLNYTNSDWTPPENWDDGISGFLLDYNANGEVTHSLNSQHDRQNLSVYGQVGGNFQSWRVRALYQSSQQDQQHHFNWQQFYAFKPIRSLNAKANIGEINLDSDLFDNIRLTGFSISSDERMLPPDLQGYAPEIRGVAQTNALVTIMHQGQVLYETHVSAGPFNINTLPSSMRGILDVKITEQTGEVRTFQVSTSNLPYLTRPGQFRYHVYTGRASGLTDQVHKIYGGNIYSGDFSYGITNGFSLYGGGQLTGNDYLAAAIGIGRDFKQWGALSIDVTRSDSYLPSEKQSVNGQSFHVNYSRRIEWINSSVTLAGYRFSDGHFRSLSQYINEKYLPEQRDYRDKQQIRLITNTTLWENNLQWRTSLYLNYQRNYYWNQKQQSNYGVSIGHTFMTWQYYPITAGLSFYHSGFENQSNNSLSLTLSVPLGETGRLGYDMQHNGHSTTFATSYSSYVNEQDFWRIRAGRSSVGRVQADGMYHRHSSLADIESSVNYQEQQGVYGAVSLRGNAILTRHGIGTNGGSYTGNDTRILVDTNHISDITFNHHQARSNSMGLGVLPGVMSYQTVDTYVDSDSLNTQRHSQHTIRSITLTEGAIGYEHFDVRGGSNLYLRLTDENNQPLALGTELMNMAGEKVGISDDNGMVWLTGVHPGEKLVSNDENHKQHHIIVPAGNTHTLS